MSRALCWAILALVYSLAGCTGEVWRADSRFTAEEREGIDQGAEVWTGQQILVVYERVTGQERIGRYILRESNRTAHYFGLSDQAAGKHIPRPEREIIVLVPERVHQTPFWQVTAHEFGHSLGLDHVSDPRAIMFHSGTESSMRCLTSTDIAALCAARGCESVPAGCDE